MSPGLKRKVIAYLMAETFVLSYCRTEDGNDLTPEGWSDIWAEWKRLCTYAHGCRRARRAIDRLYAGKPRRPDRRTFNDNDGLSSCCSGCPQWGCLTKSCAVCSGPE